MLEAGALFLTPKYERIAIPSPFYNSGDLETGVRQIRNRTAEDTMPDYTATNTRDCTPSDPRITFNNSGLLVQLSFTLQGASTVLGYRLKVNGVSRAVGSLSASGYIPINLASGQWSATPNNVITIHLWTDHNDGVDVTLAQVWMAVPGMCGTTNTRVFIINLGSCEARYTHYLEIFGAAATANMTLRRKDGADAAMEYVLTRIGMSGGNLYQDNFIVLVDGIECWMQSNNAGGVVGLQCGIHLRR